MYNNLELTCKRLTVFGLVNDVFGFQIGVDRAGRQVLRTPGLDFHVLVGLQIQLEHIEHITGVEHVACGFAEIAERRGSHLYGYLQRDAAGEQDETGSETRRRENEIVEVLILTYENLPCRYIIL